MSASDDEDISAAPAKRPNFAPVSGEPSGRLRLAAGYFTLSGQVGLGFMALGVALSLIRGTPTLMHMLQLLPIGVTAAIGAFWTGNALRERRMAGWYSALITLAVPLIASIVKGQFHLTSIVLGVASLAFLISVRSELE